MIPRVLILPVLLCAAPAWAAGCEEVVADTVGEMRAGAAGWWSDDVENLVRAAAGSACMKALSGRYGSVAAQTPPAGPAAPGAAAMSGEAVAEASAQPDSATAAPAASPASKAEEDSEAGAFSFGGLTFRSLSGSPSKKPYERARESEEN
jgi:hypothetical protein